jgi:hypothetical protein
MIKECNVLGNGPSRKSYIPNDLPSIGCKFPWTKVDITTLVCHNSVNAFLQSPHLIPDNTKILLKQKAYDYIMDNGYSDIFKNRILGVYKSHNLRTSAGHDACLWMISQGFNKLNLYGFDHYFGDILCLDSYTTNAPNINLPRNIRNKDINDSKDLDWFKKRNTDWLDSWKVIAAKYPNIELNFIP